jgi:YidC/Oxa1 family membrane protein insertase
LLDWLYTAISWVLLRWHDLFSTFLPKDGGVSWALSIMFLVITLRVLMFRFFVKQVKTQRAMQELQPKMQELRRKYKDDRQTLSREIMALQQEAGVNMLAGCLPILLQAPVFLALFHVLKSIGPKASALLGYGWQQDEITSATNAKLFGAPIAAAFNTPVEQLEKLGGSQAATRIVTLVLIVCMVCATYLTQRMIMNRQVTQLDAQQAMIQKLMLYGMPASLAVSGFFFPVGILLYWFTNNLWTLGQQFYILRRMPMKTPTGAEKKPTVDPKLLAPKPGAKPLHPKNRRAQGTDQPAVKQGDGADASGAGQPDRVSGDGAGGSKAVAKSVPGKAVPPDRTPPERTPAKKAGPAKAAPAGADGGARQSGTAGTQQDGTAGTQQGGGADGTRGGSTNGGPAKRTPARSGGNRSRSGKKRRR